MRTLHGLCTALLLLVACSDDNASPGSDMGPIDASNSPSCEPLKLSLLEKIDPSTRVGTSHLACGTMRDCKVIPVNCCLDPLGQIVVNFESVSELTQLAEQYNQLCPESCACSGPPSFSPGCMSGSQLCGYN